jgi:hypothetical protein
VRVIQDARKEADYNIADHINLQLSGGEFVKDIIDHHGTTIQEETLSIISDTISHPDITKSIEL